MIKIIPVAGLANRMRAIDSALALSLETNQKLEIIWEMDQLMSCRFEDLFKPIKKVKITNTRRLPLIYRKADKRNLSLPHFLRTIKGYEYFSNERSAALVNKKTNLNDLITSKKTIISSYSRFYPNPHPYQAFEPIDELQQQILDHTKAFNEHTVGIHIRRSDNTKSIENSPLSLFEQAIRKELSKNPNASFYLASDCQETKQELLEKFGDQIATDMSPVSRNSREDIQRALVELYVLSKTSKVFGSYWSSFSDTACHISGIKNITVRKV
ncbi:hypothetical protein [Marinoscillum sp.]|uniref:hypothetical protein n=1 Tax=Marinoscillum sp. TaxID=2024838 RepID=UPI003BA9F8F2